MGTKMIQTVLNSAIMFTVYEPLYAGISHSVPFVGSSKPQEERVELYHPSMDSEELKD